MIDDIERDARRAEECRDVAVACLDEILRINRAMMYLATKKPRPWWARRAAVTRLAIDL